VDTLRRWWPIGLSVVVAVGLQLRLNGRYDVSGHAAEHLGSAGAVFAAIVVATTILWCTPAARRDVAVLVSLAAWSLTTVAVLIGNLRVVDDLVAAGFAHVPTGSVPDVADHGLANLAPWLGVLASLAVIAAVRRRHQISTGTAAGAAMASIIVFPWFFPGFGVVVVAIARAIAFARAGRLREQVGDLVGDELGVLDVDVVAGVLDGDDGRG
jgi:hypothetical protein